MHEIQVFNGQFAVSVLRLLRKLLWFDLQCVIEGFTGHTYLLFSMYKLEIHVIHDRSKLFGPRREKTCLLGFANSTGADQPAHPRRLISALVIRFLESIISRLATSKISIF